MTRNRERASSWRRLVWPWGRSCGSCDLAAPAGWATARDDRPLPLLCCPSHVGPTWPCDGARCPHFRRWNKAAYDPSRQGRREGDMGVSGGVIDRKPKKGKKE